MVSSINSIIKKEYDITTWKFPHAYWKTHWLVICHDDKPLAWVFCLWIIWIISIIWNDHPKWFSLRRFQQPWHLRFQIIDLDGGREGVDGWGSIFFRIRTERCWRKWWNEGVLSFDQFCRFELMEVCKLLHSHLFFFGCSDLSWSLMSNCTTKIYFVIANVPWGMGLS